jgi:hypothetical protein
MKMSDIDAVFRYIRDTMPRLAKITRVDNERMVMDIEWLMRNTGLRTRIPIVFPTLTPRTFVGAMPEEGGIVACMCMPGSDDPIPVGYLPANYRAALNFDELEPFVKLGEPPDGKMSLGKHIMQGVRPKLRKLYPGEVLASAAGGAELFLSDDVVLESGSTSEFVIRSKDDTIYANSLNFHRSTDGARLWDGMIRRSVAMAYDHDGASIEVDSKGNPLNYKHLLPASQLLTETDGSMSWVATLQGVRLDDGGLPFVEVRRAISEMGDGALGLTEDNAGADLESLHLGVGAETHQRLGYIIESTQGTLVGYDPLLSPDTYGKVLRPQIFEGPYDTFPTVTEIPITGQAPHFSEVRLWAAASMWKMPMPWATTRSYVDKEGHVFLHVGASAELENSPFDPKVEHPLGGGRSVEANFDGSIKAVIGKNANDEESLIVDTLGKVTVHLGSNDGVPQNNGRMPTVDGKPHTVSGKNPRLDKSSKGAERISLQGTTDGGITLNVGRANAQVKRKHIKNGWSATGDAPSSKNVRNAKREDHGEGDAWYRHHDLSTVANLHGITDAYGKPIQVSSPTMVDPDFIGQSLDAHFAGDAFLRLGRDTRDGKSLTLDAKGGLIFAVGAELRDNRSIIAGLDGGIEAAIGKNTQSGYSIQAYLEGGIRLHVGHGKDDKAFNVTYHSSVDTETEGDVTNAISGSLTETIGAQHDVTISGNDQWAIAGERNVVTRGKSVETIGMSTAAPAKQISIGMGDYLLEIIKGNITERTKLGDVLVETLLGSITQKTKAGDILIETLLGNAKFRTALGNIVIETVVGRIDINALQVGIGLPGPRFPVMLANHPGTPCLLLGSPHVSTSSTVFASM